MIVGALHGDVDPDARVANGDPVRIGGWLMIPRAEWTTPLWRIYEPAAIVIAADQERKIEAVLFDGSQER